VQATVHQFDPATGRGSVLLDDGTRLVFGADAFEASGLRLLRTGQRLTVEVRDHEVVRLRLLGV
jgi:2-phospho-L-lactate/phosphoenolpyruvate guanylyltransferase